MNNWVKYNSGDANLELLYQKSYYGSKVSVEITTFQVAFKLTIKLYFKYQF